MDLLSNVGDSSTETSYDKSTTAFYSLTASNLKLLRNSNALKIDDGLSTFSCDALPFSRSSYSYSQHTDHEERERARPIAIQSSDHEDDNNKVTEMVNHLECKNIEMLTLIMKYSPRDPSVDSRDHMSFLTAHEATSTERDDGDGENDSEYLVGASYDDDAVIDSFQLEKINQDDMDDDIFGMEL